jgi:fatty acid desaturase
MGMACLFWFILGLDLSGPLSRQSYLVEQFQRRNKVAAKTYMALFLPLLAIPVIGVLFSVPSIMILVVLLAGFLPLLAVTRRVSWH